MKRMLSILLLAAVVLSLTGCSGGVDQEKAHADVAAFFEAVAAEDFAAAESYLHPSRQQDLEIFFAVLEGQNPGLDFQAGVTVAHDTNFSWSWYTSKVSGSQYTRAYVLTVGEVTLHATVQIVRNGDGYGIYELSFDTP